MGSSGTSEFNRAIFLTEGSTGREARKRLKICAHCTFPRIGAVALHVCGECELPQSLAVGDENEFEALGLHPAFEIDLAVAERRFYEISRALHPDRFAGAPESVKALSMQRMGWVNDAWSRLKDPEQRREVMVRLYGGPEGGQGPRGMTAAPPAIAAEWFEVQEAAQEAAMEEPDSARKTLEDFAGALAARASELESELASLERRFDGLSEEARRAQDGALLLSRLRETLRERGYLVSLGRDVARLQERISAA
jgi:molecular chaperone HscB